MADTDKTLDGIDRNLIACRTLQLAAQKVLDFDREAYYTDRIDVLLSQRLELTRPAVKA